MPALRALLVALLTALLTACLTALAGPATAAPAPVPWVGTNPYGFAIGDSVLEQCHPDFGMSWRSLGFAAWPGATTSDMRDRLTSDREGYPYTTEPSNADERTWFRDAGWLVVALGTNDVWRGIPIEQTRANIDWLMTQARGRPVLWFDVQQSDAFGTGAWYVNAELHAAATRWPNLRILPWTGWVAENHDELLDGVHVKTYEYGCEQGRNRLIEFGAPAENSSTATPTGYWYEDPATTGTVHLNGWGAADLPTAGAPVTLNVRSDWGHVGRFPVASPSSDVWAQAADGLSFSVPLTANFRGHLICLDLVDAADRWTSLGCRTP